MESYLNLKALQDYDEYVKKQFKDILGERKNKKVNCPNCGAPIIGTMCEYCGTDFRMINIY